MKSIELFLNFLLENWTFIITILACGYLAFTKIKNWNSLSEEEKIDRALTILREQMLSYVADAEKTFGAGTGTLKRSEVIKKVYEDYPILSNVVKQDQLILVLDKYIDESLVELRRLLEDNEEFKKLLINKT